MPRTGRATKLTPQTQELITKAVALGVPVVSAALHAGVASSTVRQWLQRGAGTAGRPAREVYVAFVAAVEKARAEDEMRRLLRIEQAARGGAILHEKVTTHADGRVVREVKHAEPQWTADAWVLECSRPETWARKDRYDLNLVVQRAAAKVAEGFGLTAEQVLSEATLLLKEVGYDPA
jgi:hypothetical protein